MSTVSQASMPSPTRTGKTSSSDLLAVTRRLWSEDAYLWLTDHTSRLVELNDGHLEPLADADGPSPNDPAKLLFLAFHAFIPRRAAARSSSPRCGSAFAPARCGNPDLLLVKDASDPRRQNRFWTERRPRSRNSQPPAAPNAISKRNRPTTPPSACPNTGSSIHRSKPLRSLVSL